MKKLLSLFFEIGITFTVVVIIYGCDSGKKEYVDTVPDLDSHPVYQAYTFDESDSVIYIGTQPLYIPTGLITEAIKRDTLLHESLDALGMKIEFFPYFKGNDVNHFIRNGSLDAGVGGDMPALSIASTHDVIIPALVQYGRGR